MKLDFAPFAQLFASFAVKSFFNRKGCKELRRVRKESIRCVFSTHQYQNRFLEAPANKRERTLFHKIGPSIPFAPNLWHDIPAVHRSNT